MTELPDTLERDPRDDVWDGWRGAALQSDEIEGLCKEDPKLIYPFDRDNLRAARYKLTLGNEAVVGGNTRRINANKPLVIEPHQVAIVKTHEEVTLPRFIVARWSLTVDWYYNGLLWTGAPQVDPGWRGYLPCPLYNLSDHPVIVKYREPMFSIDFERTTRYIKGISIPYDTPPTDEHPLNPPLRYYDSKGLRSGPYEALQDLQELVEF